MRTIIAPSSSLLSLKASLPTTPPPTTSNSSQRTPWHSPVPYLFGGLAAMLGLIAFALLILACSYWKLSGHLDDGENGERDLESGDDVAEKEGESGKPVKKVYEEKILVIMAGDETPTFLATPVFVKFPSLVVNHNDQDEKIKDKAEENSVKSKEELGKHDQQFTTEEGTTETLDRDAHVL